MATVTIEVPGTRTAEERVAHSKRFKTAQEIAHEHGWQLEPLTSEDVRERIEYNLTLPQESVAMAAVITVALGGHVTAVR